MTCPNYNADYCMAHDYDHVLERREIERLYAESAAETAILTGATVHARRDQVDGLVVDASDLGMRAGQWADAIIVPDRSGSPVTFRRGTSTIDPRENELLSVAYVASLPSGPVTLVVVND